MIWLRPAWPAKPSSRWWIGRCVIKTSNLFALRWSVWVERGKMFSYKSLSMCVWETVFIIRPFFWEQKRSAFHAFTYWRRSCARDVRDSRKFACFARLVNFQLPETENTIILFVCPPKFWINIVGTIVSPKRNWEQCLFKIWENKQRVLWYFLFRAIGQFRVNICLLFKASLTAN